MTFFIPIRVLLSVSANALQKRLLLDGIRVTPVWLVTYPLMLVPGLLLVMLQPVMGSATFWWNVLAGGCLDAIANLAMIAALRSTDLSIFGPLNAFRPILAMLFGWLFLGESPTPIGALAVAIIIGGALILLNDLSTTAAAAGESNKPQNSTARGGAFGVLFFRLFGLSLSTVGAVFLKRASQFGSAELTLFGWTGCGLVCLFAFTIMRQCHPVALVRTAMQQHGSWLALHALAFFAMQWLTIRIFQQTLLAYSFAYFQLAMVLQVLSGRVLFRERHFRRRLAASGVMCLGSALLAWKG